MPFCKNCGTQLSENSTFCSNCGTPVQDTQASANAQPPVYPTQPVANDAADAQNNKAMGILSYFGILVLIPLFAAKGSKFAQYHARQGVTLAVFEIAYSIVYLILTAILNAIFPLQYSWLSVTRGPVYTILTTILGLLSIFFCVLAIIGIVNAAKGEKKELPLIGKIDIIGMFTKK